MKLCKLYTSPHIIKLAGHVAGMGEIRNACRVYIGKRIGKRHLGIPKRKGKGNRLLKCVLRSGL
jgi:hypothetical protein